MKIKKQVILLISTLFIILFFSTTAIPLSNDISSLCHGVRICSRNYACGGGNYYSGSILVHTGDFVCPEDFGVFCGSRTKDGTCYDIDCSECNSAQIPGVSNKLSYCGAGNYVGSSGIVYAMDRTCPKNYGADCGTYPQDQKSTFAGKICCDRDCCVGNNDCCEPLQSISHSYYQCVPSTGDIYWYKSDNTQEELKQDCITSCSKVSGGDPLDIYVKGTYSQTASCILTSQTSCSYETKQDECVLPLPTSPLIQSQIKEVYCQNNQLTTSTLNCPQPTQASGYTGTPSELDATSSVYCFDGTHWTCSEGACYKDYYNPQIIRSSFCESETIFRYYAPSPTEPYKCILSSQKIDCTAYQDQATITGSAQTGFTCSQWTPYTCQTIDSVGKCATPLPTTYTSTCSGTTLNYRTSSGNTCTQTSVDCNQYCTDKYGIGSASCVSPSGIGKCVCEAAKCTADKTAKQVLQTDGTTWLSIDCGQWCKSQFPVEPYEQAITGTCENGECLCYGLDHCSSTELHSGLAYSTQDQYHHYFDNSIPNQEPVGWENPAWASESCNTQGKGDTCTCDGTSTACSTQNPFQKNIYDDYNQWCKSNICGKDELKVEEYCLGDSVKEYTCESNDINKNLPFYFCQGYNTDATDSDASSSLWQVVQPSSCISGSSYYCSIGACRLEPGAGQEYKDYCQDSENLIEYIVNPYKTRDCYGQSYNCPERCRTLYGTSSYTGSCQTNSQGYGSCDCQPISPDTPTIEILEPESG
ncbi:MAG: hypothetical protein KKG60_00175, partial [Nanoarchaeota archaeon]|nr:hypothetical protein [Nanoarchaeota archaeon]